MVIGRVASWVIVLASPGLAPLLSNSGRDDSKVSVRWRASGGTGHRCQIVDDYDIYDCAERSAQTRSTRSGTRALGAAGGFAGGVCPERAFRRRFRPDGVDQVCDLCQLARAAAQSPTKCAASAVRGCDRPGGAIAPRAQPRGARTAGPDRRGQVLRSSSALTTGIELLGHAIKSCCRDKRWRSG